MDANESKYPKILTEKEHKRFWSKVDKNGPWALYRKSPGKCWVWTAYIDKNGYGTFKVRKNSVLAHRLSFITNKHLPFDFLVVDHLCRNRSCVNPDHLESVTSRVNTIRGVSPAANNSSKFNCSRGHKLDFPNLVPSSIKKGKRDCLACKKAQQYLLSRNGDKKIISDKFYEQIKETHGPVA